MKIKSEKIVIKGGHVPTKMDNIHEHFQAIKQGVGSPKPKKGRGSYRREKYKGGGY